MNETVLTGRVYDIQGFSVQDGPGIRTTAFLKGCPLRCPWCHSPESQAFYKQLSWIAMKCLGTEACGERCIRSCPRSALEHGAKRSDPKTGSELQMVHVKRDVCDNCGKCAERCYAGALSVCGTDYTVDELVARLLQDRSFYEHSGGGVTISGGEALCQPAFTTEVLRRLKAEGIHTALDTTGYADWKIVAATMPYTDLYLYDLKHMDSKKHLAVIKVPNEKILENARLLAENGKKLQIRIPVIPRFNEDEENIRAAGAFCAQLGDAVETVQLLPYHNLGVTKYLRISDGKAVQAVPPSDEKMQQLLHILQEYGLNVSIH